MQCKVASSTLHCKVHSNRSGVDIDTVDSHHSAVQLADVISGAVMWYVRENVRGVEVPPQWWEWKLGAFIDLVQGPGYFFEGLTSPEDMPPGSAGGADRPRRSPVLSRRRQCHRLALSDLYRDPRISVVSVSRNSEPEPLSFGGGRRPTTRRTGRVAVTARSAARHQEKRPERQGKEASGAAAKSAPARGATWRAGDVEAVLESGIRRASVDLGTPCDDVAANLLPIPDPALSWALGTVCREISWRLKGRRSNQLS